MKLFRLLAMCFALSLIFVCGVPGQTGLFPVEGSNNEWHVDEANRTADVRFGEFLGRPAIWLKNGSQVMRTGLDFTDGTIEFDIAPMDKGNFFGLLFRRQSFSDHENIYFRLHQSGRFNAVQYAPRANGPTWQLYPEFNAIAEFPRNQWTRIRVEIRDGKLDVFVGDAAKPVLSVPRLRGLAAKGAVALWGRVNQKPAEWAVAVSNLSIRPSAAATPTPTQARPALPPGTINAWEVADPIEAAKEIPLALPAGLTGWRKAEAEESGLINLNRLWKRKPGNWTAYARTTIDSPAAAIARLGIGYSDNVTVYLNREPVFSGVNGFDSRHPEYLGFVNPDHEHIFIKLRPGSNELIVAVTDDQRFGWGFAARLTTIK